MSKHSLSTAEKEGSTTKFLYRDDRGLTCPYYNNPKATDDGDAMCGDWCPLFDLVESKGVSMKVQLHCGSGNAEYELEK